MQNSYGLAPLVTVHDQDGGFCQNAQPDHHEGFAQSRRGPAHDRPTRLALLELGEARVIHVMGELFVEYQFAAQAQRPDEFIAVAGLGDAVHTYVPTAEAFAQGGYEVKVTRTTAEAEGRLKAAIADLLR